MKHLFNVDLIEGNNKVNVVDSVTRLGDLLVFGRLFKAFGNT